MSGTYAIFHFRSNTYFLLNGEEIILKPGQVYTFNNSRIEILTDPRKFRSKPPSQYYPKHQSEFGSNERILESQTECSISPHKKTFNSCEKRIKPSPISSPNARRRTLSPFESQQDAYSTTVKIIL